MEKGAVGDCEARAAGDVGTADCGRGKGVRRAFAFPPFWVFGMGFYWAWLMVAFYTPVLTSNADGTPQFVQDIWTWSAWAHAATLLGCAVAGERAVRLGRRCSASVAVPLATALATALIPVGCLLAATSQPVAAVAVALGAIVAGVGTGFMVFMWSAVYLRADSTVSTWGIVGSYLLSSVLYVLVRLLPDGLALLAEVCLPLLSGFFGSAVLVLNPSDLSTAWGLVRGPRAGGGASGAGDATFPASPSSPASSPTSAAADPDPDPIAEVARAYGLSPRECDVARLLFKGRSLPFVMSELSIAKGTAETHLNHIYRKLGVHTRQEFITLVERVAGQAARTESGEGSPEARRLG